MSYVFLMLNRPHQSWKRHCIIKEIEWPSQLITIRLFHWPPESKHNGHMNGVAKGESCRLYVGLYSSSLIKLTLLNVQSSRLRNEHWTTSIVFFLKDTNRILKVNWLIWNSHTGIYFHCNHHLFCTWGCFSHPHYLNQHPPTEGS